MDRVQPFDGSWKDPSSLSLDSAWMRPLGSGLYWTRIFLDPNINNSMESVEVGAPAYGTETARNPEVIDLGSTCAQAEPVGAT